MATAMREAIRREKKNCILPTVEVFSLNFFEYLVLSKVEYGFVSGKGCFTVK